MVSRRRVLVISLGSALAVSALLSAQPQDKRPVDPCVGNPAVLRPCAPDLDRPLAEVSGKPVSWDDVDAAAREAAQGLEAKLAQARRDALEDAIRDRLLELDSRKSGVSPDLLYVREVLRRMRPLTEEEIRSEFTSRPALAKVPFDSVRDRLAGDLRDRQEARLFAERTDASRKRHRVVRRADVERPDLRPETVLVVVDGEPIRWGEVAERAAPLQDEARWKAYQAQRAALEAAIRERLLDAEAARRQTTREEVVKSEVTEKARRPSREEVEAFFAEYREEFDGDLNASRAEIEEILAGDAQAEAEETFYDRLKAAASVTLALREPDPVALRIPAEGPSHGNAAAPVTIIEFSDFECPPCRRMVPLIEGVLQSYGDRVRLVMRQRPLSIHPRARRAAEAAMAADAQGKFWPYAELLFRNQKALAESDLRRYATDAGLDVPRFESALASDAIAALVVRDLRDARRYAVKGTPTLFISGVRFRDMGPGDESLRRAIDRALEKARAASPAL